MRIRKEIGKARWIGRYAALKDDTIVPTTEVIKRLKRGTIVERASPFKAAEITEVLRRFGALNDDNRAVMNWHKFVPTEQRRVLLEALQVLPCEGWWYEGGDEA